MFIKNILITVAFIVIAFDGLFAQFNKAASIVGYTNKSDQYFHDRNKVAMSELKALDSMYDCYVSFRIDTTGRVIDLFLTETLPNRMPAVLINYIKKIFYSSSGKWLPQVKDSRKVISDELVWYVDVLKANQTIDERATETESILIRKLDAAVNRQIEDRYRSPLNKGSSIVFSYYGDKSELCPTSRKQE